MPESLTTSKKLQWKWVGITIVLYAVFYLFPLFLFGSIIASSKVTAILFSGWIFAGIIIIAAVAGYISKGVTLWEPAIAGAGLIFFFFLGIMMFLPNRPRIFETIIPLLIVTAIVFLLSLLGAWLGERAQKLWKTKSPESI
jgi:hypothetical protein